MSQSETGHAVPRTVSVLCAARRSVYRDLLGVEVYDKHRDARTFAGDTPIIAHPPCRGWSAKTRHQAKPEPGEMELGLWCAEQLRRCGGVLEQPAWSHLFAAADLPPPLQTSGDLWTLEVDQYWWGFPTRKPTWLCFCCVDPCLVHVPLRLRARGKRNDPWPSLSKAQRSFTVEPLAVWLVDIARQARVNWK